MLERAPQSQSVRSNILRLPLFLLLFGVVSGSMLVPAVYAGVVRELVTARAFLYSGLLREPFTYRLVHKVSDCA